MVPEAVTSLVYGAALATLGWRSRATPRLRPAAVGGVSLGGLACLGGALLLLGEPAGRGVALLAATVAFLVGGWTLAQGLLRTPPEAVGRGATLAIASGLVAAMLVSGGCAPGSRSSGPAARGTATERARPVDEAGEPVLGIEEPSGIARAGDRILIVGDEEPGTWYSLPVPASVGRRIALAPARLTRHRLPDRRTATDLEAIGTLADGRIVLLSEDLHALLDENGVVATYDELAEVSGRGCEGLDVRALGDGASRVAVLWEGGYPQTGERSRADTPRVFVHDVPAGASGLEVTPDDLIAEILLHVPLPPGEEPRAQRFRCPDLVWHRLRADDPDSWGFIVLLSSGWAARPAPGSEEECPERVGGEPLRWCYKWIQRFDASGEPVGEPFDLAPVLPEPIRRSNWEGMGWLEPGRRLVLVYDESLADRVLDPQEAVVVELPEGW